MQIFKIDFSMRYNYGHDMVYNDRLSVGETVDREFSTYVYVREVDGHLRELVTGMEIPRIIDGSVPGFGAYRLRLVSTLGDHDLLRYYLGKCKEAKAQFEEALRLQKEWGDEVEAEYRSNVSLSTGKSQTIPLDDPAYACYLETSLKCLESDIEKML